MRHAALAPAGDAAHLPANAPPSHHLRTSARHHTSHPLALAPLGSLRLLLLRSRGPRACVRRGGASSCAAAVSRPPGNAISARWVLVVSMLNRRSDSARARPSNARPANPMHWSLPAASHRTNALVTSCCEPPHRCTGHLLLRATAPTQSCCLHRHRPSPLHRPCRSHHLRRPIVVSPSPRPDRHHQHHLSLDPPTVLDPPLQSRATPISVD
jgi:hypothetical protein